MGSTSLGFMDCITSRNGDRSKDIAKVDLCYTEPYNVQCKAVESGIIYHRLLNEMPKDDNINIVFHKKQCTEIVAMSKADFYQLLNSINNGTTDKRKNEPPQQPAKRPPGMAAVRLDIGEKV